MHVFELFLRARLGVSGLFQQDWQLPDTQKHMLLYNFTLLRLVTFQLME